MGFCFKQKESVAKAIPRLGCERVRRARECLEDCARPEAVHGARKEIKKAKALLRLASESISKKEFRSVRKSLRQAADSLARARDASVRSDTLREVSRRFKKELPAGAFRKFRVQLRRASDKAMRQLVEKHKAESAAEYLQKAESAFRKLTVENNGWNAIAPGVRKAYRRCQAAFAHAVKSEAAEDFHEWRKRAKDLWYQLTVLEHSWPEKIDRMACELETVGEYLGEDHDLFILQQSLEVLHAKNGHRNAREINALRKIIQQRQAELRGKAIATGKYFYAEKPFEFCERLGSYWRAWQRGKKAG